jgi:hypothetical protein
MFDWQGDAKAQSSNSNEGTEVVSKHFGIYWLISLPLTVAVLLTWRTWWHREKNRYRRKYPHVKLDSGIGSSISNRLEKMIWRRKGLKDIEKSE